MADTPKRFVGPLISDFQVFRLLNFDTDLVSQNHTKEKLPIFYKTDFSAA